MQFNPIAFRKAKTVCNFGLSGCNRVKFKHATSNFKYQTRRFKGCMQFNPIALIKAKIVFNLGLSECNWVKLILATSNFKYHKRQSFW